MTKPCTKTPPRPAAALVVRLIPNQQVFLGGPRPGTVVQGFALVPIQVVDFYAAAPHTTETRKGL